MADKTVNLKVFFKDDARRFTVEESACTNFEFMKQKLQTIFPALRNQTFKITWKDTEGDEITISSDEDLITAFTELSSNIKVLYVSTNDGFKPSGNNQSCAFNPSDMQTLGALARQYLGPVMATLNNAQTQGASATSTNSSKDKSNSDGKKSSDKTEANNQGCPFSNGFDGKDMHSLGAMAQQYLGPFLETLNAQAQNSGAASNSQEGVFADIIRNAAEGFFGNTVSNAQTQSTQSEPSTSKTSTSSTSTATPSHQTNLHTGSSSNGRNMEEALAQLRRMGYNMDEKYLVHLLEGFEGNVAAVTKALSEM